MRVLSIASLLLLATTAAAQPVLTSGAISYVPGESFVERICPWFDPGPAGAAQVWDFSALVCPSTFTSNWIAPTPWMADAYPGVTVAFSSQSFHGMYQAGTDAFRYLGHSEGITLTSAIYDDPADEVRYPFTYGDSYLDTWGGMSYFPNGMGGQDSAALSGTLLVEADAYGSLTLPWGTVPNVIRLHKVRVGPSGTGTVTEEEYRYHEPGVHHPWLRTYRRTNSETTTVVESLRYWAPVSSGLGEEAAPAVRVHCAHGMLTVPMPANGIAAYLEIRSMDGRLVQQWSVPIAGGGITLNVSALPEAAYILRYQQGNTQGALRFVKN